MARDQVKGGAGGKEWRKVGNEYEKFISFFELR